MPHPHAWDAIACCLLLPASSQQQRFAWLGALSSSALLCGSTAYGVRLSDEAALLNKVLSRSSYRTQVDDVPLP
jgi:hypothetical protein